MKQRAKRAQAAACHLVVMPPADFGLSAIALVDTQNRPLTDTSKPAIR